MDFNLIEEHWLPAARGGGSVVHIAPWEIVGGDPPVTDIAAPRAEFRVALLEFLVGLVQTACPPRDDREWRARLNDPPTPDELHAALAPLAPYFNLFSAAPRFLQDAALTPGSTKDISPVRDLLTEDTTGHFAPEGADHAFCPACAAMALFTLQSFAPAGGRGHMTSLRGGGPLSTLVRGDTLWRTVWANVLPLSAGAAAASAADLASGRVFPWAGPRIPAEGMKDKTWPDDQHFLHAYWGMPRRIMLLPEETAGPVPCALCDQAGTVVVRSYAARPNGFDYGDTWRHPLSPYRVQGGDKPTLAVKGTANITGYTHWLGVVYGEPDGARAPVVPAACVRHFRDALEDAERDIFPGVGAAGFDMDKMKPLQWCEGSFPLYHVALEAQEEFRIRVESMVQAAEETRKKLTVALKVGLFAEGTPLKADASLFVNAASAFWASTEGDFYDLAGKCAAAPGIDASTLQRVAWAKRLRAAALKVFDRETARGRFRPEEARRVVGARRMLLATTAKMLPGLLSLPEDWKEETR